MKPSRYNIFVPTTGAVLGFNTYTNTYLAMSHKAYDGFKAFEASGDFSALCSTFPNVYGKMLGAGFMIPDDGDELAMLRFQNKQACFASRDLQLMVYPTQDCNLCCWYCYESHVPNTRMTPEVMKSVIRYVEQQLAVNAFDSIRLSFFGGEPLTDFEHIAYPLALEVKRMVEDAGKKFSCFIVTNASLIDTHMVEQLRQIAPIFQITLDGCREKHDKVRKGKHGGEPTYDHIMWALRTLADCEEIIPLGITLRINYDNETLQRIQEVLDDLEGIDKRKLYVHFERVWQTSDSVDTEQRKQVLNTLRQFVKRGYAVSHGAFSRKAIACPADTNSLVIVNYDGSVHKCNGRTLTSQTAYGTLYADGHLVWNTQALANRIGQSTFENPACLQCRMLPLCMGPCSQKLLEHGGYDSNICSMRAIDTSLQEYLLLDFQTKRLISQYKAELV